MTEEMMQSAPSGNRRWIGVLVVLAGLVIVVLVATAAVVVLDPFNLHVIDRITGRYDAALTAMPQDTMFYMGLNLANASQARFERLTAPFLSEADSADPMKDFLDDLDELLMDGLGLTIRDDVQPWIGQYIGFGFREVGMDSFGFPETADWIIAAESRDAEAADRFLDKLGQGWSKRRGLEWIPEQYRDAEMVTWRSEDPFESLSYARSGSVVVFASSTDSAKLAIDALKGESMADLESYRRLLPELPRERALTFFMDANSLEDLVGQLESQYTGTGFDPTTFQTDTFRSLAFTVALVEAGLRGDFFIDYDLDKLPEAQRELLLMAGSDPQLLSKVPDETLLFLGGHNLSLYWESMQETMETQEMGADFDEALTLFREEYRLDPARDLFPQLTGDWALTVGPKPGELDLVLGEVPLTIVFLSGVGDEAGVDRFLDQTTDLLQSTLFIPIERSTMAGRTIYQLKDSLSDEATVVYGVADGHLFIGSTREVIEETFDEGASLADSERFRTAMEAFDSEMAVAFYLDFEGLLSAFGGLASEAELLGYDEDLRYLRPIKRLVVATAPPKDGLVHSTAIVFIEAE